MELEEADDVADDVASPPPTTNVLASWDERLRGRPCKGCNGLENED